MEVVYVFGKTKCALVKSVKLFNHVWATCIASSDTAIYIGDSSGQLIYFTLDNGMDKCRKVGASTNISILSCFLNARLAYCNDSN